MLDSNYHVTLRLLSGVKRYSFVIVYTTLLWTSYYFPKIDKPQILLHGVISLPNVTSYDKLY